MKMQRTIPPAAATISMSDLLHGLQGFLLGKQYLRELETGLKEYFGVRHVFFLSSGKASLALILKALATLSPERKKVLIPAYTCFSVPSAIVKAGLSAAACDVAPETYDFNYQFLKQQLTPDTLCVISTHLFGIPADCGRVVRLCKTREIFVVEDAAQAMGGTSKGKKLGTMGDVGFFSLGRGKNITCGSGGIIVTNNDRVAAAIENIYRTLRYPSLLGNVRDLLELLFIKTFIHPGLFWIPSGMPFLKLGQTFFYSDFPEKRLSGVKAGMLRSWRGRLYTSNRVRRDAGVFYNQELSTPNSADQAETCYLRFPVLVKDRETRDSVIASAKAHGVSVMYPAPINEIAAIKEQFIDKSFPGAKSIAEKLVTLPTHELVREENRISIRNVIRKAPYTAAPNVLRKQTV